MYLDHGYPAWFQARIRYVKRLAGCGDQSDQPLLLAVPEGQTLLVLLCQTRDGDRRLLDRKELGSLVVFVETRVICTSCPDHDL